MRMDRVLAGCVALLVAVLCVAAVDITNTTGVTFSKNVWITPLGGIAVKLTAGENLTAGNVVYCATADSNVYKTVAGTLTSKVAVLGAVYETSTTGNDVWIVVSGIANVLLADAVSCARGDVIYASDTVDGKVDGDSNPPPATINNHWAEVGHALESKAAGSLVKSIIHQN